MILALIQPESRLGEPVYLQLCDCPADIHHTRPCLFKELFAQPLRIPGSQVQRGSRHSCLVSATKMKWIEAIIAQFLNIDNCPSTIRQSLRIAFVHA